MNKQKATLLLADGTVFYGSLIGKHGTNGGEICFNTGMTGYQEIYTDPSYTGQIVVNTTAHIGNYGVMDEESESDGPFIAGLVVNDFSDGYSRINATQSLQEYLVQHNITGIADIDTRKLVRHIRAIGAMSAIAPAVNVVRVPYIILLRMSRPSSSVPSGCPAVPGPARSAKVVVNCACIEYSAW